jgi:hypothetical protein
MASKRRGGSACPVCIWPLSTVPGQEGDARYGHPDADDEQSVSDNPYLHALADAIRLNGRVPLCKRHERELAEIVRRDKTGKHPKENDGHPKRW